MIMAREAVKEQSQKAQQPRPLSNWRARFSILPSLLRPEEADEMKALLRAAPEDFDEDIDGVDKMLGVQRPVVKNKHRGM